MGCWLFGCFKWRRRRHCHTLASSDEAAVHAVEERAFANKHVVGTAQSDPFTERNELESDLAGDGLEKEASASVRVRRRRPSVGRCSSDALNQLEAELESLTQKLEKEADNAQNLTNEVRSLQKWGELLDSPNAFKNAVESLRKSPQDHSEENQHATLLQTLLTQIDQNSDKEQPGCIDQALDNQMIATDIKNLGCLLNRTRLPHTSAQRSEISPSQSPEGKLMKLSKCPCDSDAFRDGRKTESHKVDSRSVEPLHATVEEIVEVQSDIETTGHKAHKLIKQDRPSFTENLIEHGYMIPKSRVDQSYSPSCLEVIEDRKSCNASSFSGFIVVEGEGSNRFSCDQLSVLDDLASGDMSGSTTCKRIVEHSDLSTKSLDESSKCLFAFSPDTSQTSSESVASSLRSNGGAMSIEIFHGHSPDSDVESHSEVPSVFASSTVQTNRGSTSVKTSTWQGTLNGLDVHTMQLASCMQDSLVEADHGMFSDAQSQSSTECSFPKKELLFDSVETSNHYHRQRVEYSASSVKPMDFDAVEPVISMCKLQPQGNSEVLSSEHCSSVMPEETHRQVGMMLLSPSKDEQSISDWLKQQTFNKQPSMTETLEEAMSVTLPRIHPWELDDDATSKQDSTLSSSSSVASSQALTLPDKHLPSVTVDVSTQALTPSSSTSASSSLMHTSFAHTLQHSLIQVKSSGTASKLQLTPSHKTWVSVPQVETPSDDAKSYKLAEDRPILGTMAAHWTHSSTQKWWDGKGIPNSTNKYKEDQRVSWHATPFEVRLERALAKQERVFQKKLFAGGMATEIEVSSGPISSPN